MENLINGNSSSPKNKFADIIVDFNTNQHIRTPSRNEPTNLTSEFNLVKTGKIDINNVVKILDKTAKHVQIAKNLKKVQLNTKVLPKPLEKPQVERIKRSTGFKAAKDKLKRWDAIVARSRTVDFVSFPLKTAENKKIEPTKAFLSNFKLKSDLEKELDAVDPPQHEESEVEEEKYPMTYQEMLEHRKEVAKLRAQHSFKAAKAKRQGKIKSKKYHRILKKEKLKKQIKEFEEMQEKDPEMALKKLEELEKARALERHTLRHKNTGKWAKSKLIRAKYDKDVRQQLSEQLAISRGLSKKVQDVEISDDEKPQDTAMINTTLQQDPNNPWLMQMMKPDNTKLETEFDFGYKKYVQQRNQRRKDSSTSESDNEEKLADQQYEIGKFTSLLADLNKKVISLDDSEEIKNTNQSKPQSEKVHNNTNFKKSSKRSVTATSKWKVENLGRYISDQVSKQTKEKNTEDIFDDLDKIYEKYEEDVEKQVESKLRKLRKVVENIEKRDKKFREKKNSKKNDNSEEISKLELKSKKVKPIVDEPLNENTAMTPTPISTIKDVQKTLASAISDIDKPLENIDPTKFIAAKAKHLSNTFAFENSVNDNLDDDEQVVPKVNIEEVFEEDDVVTTFRKEKQDEIEKDTPKDIDLSLPGWGSWGGKGIKPTKRKKNNRLILKAPPKFPRKDENKGDVIIKEHKDPRLAIHKVTELPFPFTSLKDYEASIRAPIGNTFVPVTAHQNLIKPGVFTKAGAIIEPMDEEQLLVPKNQHFKNEAIVKLLCKK